MAVADLLDTNTDQPIPPPASTQPSYEDFVRDYWAPDRNEVLARMQGPNGPSVTFDPTQRSPNTGINGGNPTPTPTPTDPTKNPLYGNQESFWQALLGSGGRTVTDLANFVKAHPEYGVTIGGSKGDKVYGPGNQFWGDAVMSAGINGGQGFYRGSANPGSPGGTGTGTGQSGGNVFSDPATTGWETLLRQVVDRLNTPQPTWTPEQLNLQQTQAIDPIERGRTQAKQNAATQLAARNITPGSGIYESTMRDIDKQFDALGAQARGNFAAQGVQQQYTVANQNNANAVQAVGLMGMIPQLADSRLASANASIQQLNPTSLLSLLNTIQQQQYNAGQNSQVQNQAFWTQLAQAIAQAFS